MAELLFLGTCAADFSPRLQTDLSDRFDKDARRSSSALLAGKYLFDCGPHTPDALKIADVDRKEITSIILTHLHPDHFMPQSVKEVLAGREENVKLYVREDADVPQIAGTEVVRMKNLVPYDVDGDLTVTALPANHDEGSFPRHLYLEYKGKRILYALDGGWMLNAAFNFLRDKRLDLLVIDATCGDYEGDWRMAEHNSIPMIRLMLPSLAAAGVTDGHTSVYLSHLAPSLHRPHDETEKIAGAFGAHVAYDGLRIEI
ncbi:MAG: MBL fold metallo-hydrolase [Clostridia bacterium]|nr:MBL fold metallo-hydrolase [Clostridia bacterium]